MSEKPEDGKFRIEKVEVAGDLAKDPILPTSARELTSETRPHLS